MAGGGALVAAGGGALRQKRKEGIIIRMVFIMAMREIMCACRSFLVVGCRLDDNMTKAKYLFVATDLDGAAAGREREELRAILIIWE